jgi:cobalt-precorrin 5A hydrolase
MTDLAIITLSYEGALVASLIRKKLKVGRIYLHESVSWSEPGARRFTAVKELMAMLFGQCPAIIFIGPIGVIVRAIGPLMRHKTRDPAIVATDIGARYVVSLLSGHEGGANDLALSVANAVGGEPVITTTSEARRDLVVGVGCRRGTSSQTIIKAVTDAVETVGARVEDIRFLATARVKAREEGLLKASAWLGVPLRIVPSEEIRSSSLEFSRSKFVESMVELPAVAEPCALLGGRRTKLVLPRTVFKGVTVAVARESCLWSE